MPADPDAIENAIETAAVGPRKVEADGQRVEAHSLADQIKAAEYARNRQAASAGGIGIRFFKTRNGGARLS